jgi:hypothetical protein
MEKNEVLNMFQKVLDAMPKEMHLDGEIIRDDIKKIMGELTREGNALTLRPKTYIVYFNPKKNHIGLCNCGFTDLSSTIGNIEENFVFLQDQGCEILGLL